ncbi:hypothetical protein BGY98DRAFT_988496 [Russula aff. rugulosa BPL654]|nr:hypothetical protein BGY98DRAFT_988496 [Russula aff. rugulosa BPL654]
MPQTAISGQIAPLRTLSATKALIQTTIAAPSSPQPLSSAIQISTLTTSINGATDPSTVAASQPTNQPATIATTPSPQVQSGSSQPSPHLSKRYDNIERMDGFLGDLARVHELLPSELKKFVKYHQSSDSSTVVIPAPLFRKAYIDAMFVPPTTFCPDGQL